MTDTDKLPDALYERPLFKGSKDMGGYFCHWHDDRAGRNCAVWIADTFDGKRTAEIQLRGGKIGELKTPKQTTVYFFFSITGQGGPPGSLFSSSDPRTIVQASNRIN